MLYGSIIKFNFICVAVFPTITNIPVYMYIGICVCVHDILMISYPELGRYF